MTAAALSNALGQPLDRRNKVDSWRFGIVYRWVDFTDRFVALHESVTVRPNQSLSNLEQQRDGIIAITDA